MRLVPRVLAAVLAAAASAQATGGEAGEAIAARYRVAKRDVWCGGARTVFEFRGCETWVVEPERPAKGMPWAWIMEWPGAYASRTGVPALLKAGFHVVTFRPGFYEKGPGGELMFRSRPGNMNDKRVAESREFQRMLVDELGLAPKANLIGMSWGGFYSVRYASFHPDCVAHIYLDAPLLDFSTLAHFSGAYYGVDPKTYVGKDDPRQPVNRAEPIAKAGIPVMLLYGGQDQTVPPESNCELFVKRFKAAGGRISVTRRAMYGHHPHGLEEGEQRRFVDFFTGSPRPRQDALIRVGDADPSASFRAAVSKLAGTGGTVRFEPGEYRLPVSSGVDMEFFISNHDQSDSHRVVFPVVGATNVTVEAEGALFVFDGKPIPFAVTDSRNVTLRGFAVDSSVPFMPEFRITGFSGKGTTFVRCDPAKSPYRIVDGRIRFRGADWEYEATHAKLFDGETRELVERSGDMFYRGEARELAPGELELMYDFAGRGKGARIGDVVVLRPGARPSPAIVAYRSEDVLLEDVAVHSSLGMSLLAQRSRNVSWRGTGRPGSRRSGVFPRASTGRYASAHADATHFSNVAGEAVVENCLFEAMMDDAMNVHSTCLFITNVVSDARIRCRYMHPQAVGFEVFRPGERLRFIDGDSLEPGAEAKVVAVETHGAEEVTLTLDGPLPKGVGAGDAVENADWQCSATFRGNIVRFNRARGTLFTTPGRVLVESNLFDRVSGTAVLLSGDAHYWFESGACRDVSIRNNVFRNCLTAYGSHGHSFGVISICPVVHDIAAQKRRYHSNVRIEDNLFETFDVPLLYVFSTDGLVWRRNRVVRNALYRGQGKPPFIVEASSNVDLGDSAARPAEAGRKVTPLSGGGWTLDGEPVTVPHTWNAVDGADGGFNPKGTFTSCRAVSYVRKAATYRRALPDPTAGRRQFVKCEGVSIKATVLVNGREVGRHKGAFTAFCFEVTDFLKPSGNVLEIVADNTLDENVPPIVGDFTMYGGVYRDVYFIETDPVCIDFVTDGADGVDIDANAATGEVVARVRVLGGTNETQRFSFPSPRLWSPEEPNMYAVTVRVSQKGSIDEVSVPFSFRTVRFDDTGFYLNGVKRKMRGACRHQDREGKGWAVSAQDEMDDVRMMKTMGCDAVRTSHYPQSRNFLDLCDRLGLMVWSETSLVNEVTFSEEFRQGMLSQAREMIAQRRNHPSIVVWGLFNEIYSGSKHKAGTIEVYLRELRDMMHGMDPSRKVVCASNQYGRRELSQVPDFCAFNVYPGWYDLRPWYWRNLDRDGTMMEGLLARLMETNALASVGIGEYGAGGSVNRHSDPFEQTAYANHDDSEEYQAFFHYSNYRAIRDCDRVWGSFIWQMFDSGSDLQKEPGRPGCNTKGLVEFDHKTPKDAFYFYKANWNPEPMLHLVGARRTETTNAVNSVFAFCNAGRVALSVNGVLVGERDPDDRKAVIWDDIRLRPGANVIEVRSGALRESCRLSLVQPAAGQPPGQK